VAIAGVIVNWEFLHEFDRQTLLDMGCRVWNAPDDPESEWSKWFPGMQLFLFPASLYDQIPDGLEVVSISGRVSRFERGKTSDDRRAGLLAFGVLRSFEKIPQPNARCKYCGGSVSGILKRLREGVNAIDSSCNECGLIWVDGDGAP
jgi:hypothetical protein